MASIYSNARFTLVVTTGKDANHGLRGFHGITQPLWRLLEIYLVLSSTGHQLTRVPKMMQTKWYSRGWSLQEIVFSRQTLFLTDEGAFWECHCRTWSENATPNQVMVFKCSQEIPDIFRDSFLKDLRWPNPHLYLQLVTG